MKFGGEVVMEYEKRRKGGDGDEFDKTRAYVALFDLGNIGQLELHGVLLGRAQERLIAERAPLVCDLEHS